ncbi:MAG TPA: BlaI/MecI/CopY family transcriptional regulator [Longimicrobiales bacterium]
MPRRPLPLPSEGELELLRVLWARGPSTVREVLEALDARRGVGYTTVLKLLQIMHGKGLVVRDEDARSHVYAAAVPEEATQHLLVSDLVQRAFGGSAAKLVLNALSGPASTPEERAEIRSLLERLGAGAEEDS